MDATEKQYFELMKTKIVAVMQECNAGINKNISDWKGNEIFEFQEDLRKKVGTYFSEKWFYTHFKTKQAKLPRIDLLNILSRYVGYLDWSEFKHQNRDHVSSIGQYTGSNRIFYLLPLLALILFGLTWWIIRQGSYATYTFCFVDRDSEQPVVNGHIEVTVMNDKESPVRILCDSAGCFTYRTNRQEIHFFVTAPYYHPDTVKRLLKKAEKSEKITLRINDYALMIDYYSNARIKDWRRRREQLDQLIADSAFICQVFGPTDMGIELYNKAEFIDMLTTPATTLQHLQVLDIGFYRNQITSIRFKRK